MRRRFVHAADLHLDSPFREVGRIRDGLDETLRDASLEAWDALVELCLVEQAEFLLIAGDVYDGGRRGVRSGSHLRRGVERLAEAGIPTLIVLGNHDPLDDGLGIEGLEGVTVFRSGQPQSVTLEHGPGVPVTVHGVSFRTRSEDANLARRFARAEVPGIQIGLLHCMVGSGDEHRPYAPCTVQDLLDADLDYWALGHIHRHRIVNTDPPVAYAGALQGRSPRPGEQGTHGVLLVGFDDEGIVDVEHRPLDRVRFGEIEVAIDGHEGLDALERALEEAADVVVAEADGRLVLVRARLTGSGPLYAALAAENAVEDLRRALDAAAPAGLVWERIVLEATAPIDLDAMRESAGLEGDLVRAFDALADDPDRLAATLAELEGALPERSVRGLASEDPQRRLVAARSLALDLLLRARGSA